MKDRDLEKVVSQKKLLGEIHEFLKEERQKSEVKLTPPKRPTSLMAKVHDLAYKSMSLSFYTMIAGGIIPFAGLAIENRGVTVAGFGIFMVSGLSMLSSMLVSQITLKAKLEDVMKNIQKK